MIFISAIHLSRDRSPARLRDGRGRLRSGAGRAGGAARQGPGLRRALSQDPAARAAERRAGAARRASAPPSWKPRPRGCCESEQRRSLALAAGNMGSWDWDLVTGDCDVGRRAVPDLRRRCRGSSPSRPSNIRVLMHPEDLGAPARRVDRSSPRAPRSYQAEFRVRRPDGEVRWCVGTAAADRRRDGQGRARQRRHHGHHRAQGGRGAPGSAGARGRPSRQERAGDRAVDRAADPRRTRQGLRRGHRGPHQGAVARAYAALAIALAGRRPRQAGRRRAGALPLERRDRIATVGPGGSAGADHGADAGARAARACHQRGEVRRAVDAGGPAVDPLGERDRPCCGWRGTRPAGRRSRRRLRAASARRA